MDKGNPANFYGITSSVKLREVNVYTDSALDILSFHGRFHQFIYHRNHGVIYAIIERPNGSIGYYYTDLIKFNPQ